MTRKDRTALTALRSQDPAKGIRLLRLLWPDIHAALEQGHTIRVIHEALTEMGMSTSYRQLCSCVARLRSEAADTEKKGGAASRQADPAVRTLGPENGNDGSERESEEDPLANIREHLMQNRPGFNFDEGQPDKHKLIG